MPLGPSLGRFWKPSWGHVGSMLALGPLKKSTQKTLQKLYVQLLPLCEKSYRADNQNFGGHFSRRICPSRPKSHSSSKTPLSWKKTNPKISKKKSPKMVFGGRKMKCRESSEMCFSKVSRRTEPSSGGKRPFKVCKKKFGVEK